MRCGNSMKESTTVSPINNASCKYSCIEATHVVHMELRWSSLGCKYTVELAASSVG